LTCPAEVEVVAGCGFVVAAEAIDVDPTRPISGNAKVGLRGLTTTTGRTSDGRFIITVSGCVPVDTPAGSAAISWNVTQEHHDSRSTTSIRIVRPIPSKGLPGAVERFVQHRYIHGMPERAARQLGPNAIPILCRMLRDPKHHSSWEQIVEAIGIIGTYQSFDTLTDFIWNRFHSKVDSSTLNSLLSAQATMGHAAAARPEVLKYLARSSDGEAWAQLPWNSGKRSLIGALCALSVNSVGAIPSSQARNFLLSVQRERPGLAGNAKEALEYQNLIIRLGRDEAFRAFAYPGLK